MKRNAFLVMAILASVLAYSWKADSDGAADLVVYCAHDSAYARPVIEQFEKQTGLHVDVRFDEEANKSLGLTNLLLAERENPRCDVFWNNQTLGTIRLRHADVLQPYLSPNAARIPEAFRDVKGYWTGFAARLRVYLVNTDAIDATPEAVHARLRADSLNRVAIAVPQFGTTLSHYSVLAGELGMDELKAWHTSLHRRGIREVRGNSMTKDLTAQGICDIGFTDTDDAYAAIDDGSPVQMLPIQLPDGRTICLPNSVSLVRDCRHPEAGKKLVDFLLSEEVEVTLANTPARQIPLGDVDESRLPDDVLRLRKWAVDSVSLRNAARMNQEVLDWLTAEHLGE